MGLTVNSTSKVQSTYRQWHQVLPASMEGTLGFLGANKLSAEHTITSFSLRADLLYIQQEKPVGEVHPIAQIFRTYNLIELKSPADRLDPSGYNQGIIYVRLYQLRFVPADYCFNNLTLTYICTQEPNLVFKFLNSLDLQVIRDSPVPGINQVYGEPFPVQIVVLDLLIDPEIAFPFTPLISADVRERLNLMMRLIEELQKDPEVRVWKEIFQFCLDSRILTKFEMEKVMKVLWTREEDAQEWKSYLEMFTNTEVGKHIRDMGFAEGISQGLSQGLSQGKQEERNNLILTAINKGADLSYLAKLFGFSEREILQIVKKM